MANTGSNDAQVENTGLRAPELAVVPDRGAAPGLGTDRTRRSEVPNWAEYESGVRHFLSAVLGADNLLIDGYFRLAYYAAQAQGAARVQLIQPATITTEP